MSIQRARKLRRNQTRAEAKLWSAFRNRQLSDLKFRRQVPLSPYIVDFLCESESLIVEVDGGRHAFDNAMTRDAERTRWLEVEGYRVLRVWNNEVLDNLERVFFEIQRTADPERPSPSSG